MVDEAVCCILLACPDRMSGKDLHGLPDRKTDDISIIINILHIDFRG